MTIAAAQHVFISVNGELLPRWGEAFPQAIACRFGKALPANPMPSVVWVRLPAGNTIEPLTEIREILAPKVVIVALSDLPNDNEAVSCFAAAARGYGNTHAVPDLLRQIADVVTQGGLWIGESLMQRLLLGTARIPQPEISGASSTWETSLTEREREVARAVAVGSSNKEIARKLGITERTIKAHVGAILNKIGARDRLQLSLVVNGHRRP